jgi:hypothetical protein
MRALACKSDEAVHKADPCSTRFLTAEWRGDVEKMFSGLPAYLVAQRLFGDLVAPVLPTNRRYDLIFEAQLPFC